MLELSVSQVEPNQLQSISRLSSCLSRAFRSQFCKQLLVSSSEPRAQVTAKTQPVMAIAVRNTITISILKPLYFSYLNRSSTFEVVDGLIQL